MFESKMSSARSSWSQMSSINHTSAPGFVPIPCPTHHEYSITNICKAPNCIEPLCPECIADHVQLHQQTKKAAKIENIITTRLTCIEQLARMKYEAQKEVDEHVGSSGGNIQQFVESHRRRLDTAQKKIRKLVDDMFSEMQKQMEVISNAFYFEKQKKQNEARVRLSPLTEYLTRLTTYKLELQSEDYIPTLIQLLNQPPKKPKVEPMSQINSFGEVEINENKFEDIKQMIGKFVKVNVNCKDEGRVNLNRSNYHASNNMKFSRFDRSRDLSGSRGRQSQMDQSRRSNSKKKIFGGDSVISQIQPATHVLRGQPKSGSINGAKQFLFNADETKLKISKPSYFLMKGCSLVYFKQNTNNYFVTDLQYPESGFEKVHLEINFPIPNNHQTVHTTNNRVFLLGGQFEDKVLNNCYELANVHSLKPIKPMQIGRARFDACFHQGYIYVVGGLTAPEHVGWGHRKATRECERYNIQTDSWEKIAPLPEAAFGMKLCALDDKILRVGGFLESGELIKRIDVYYPQQNQWESVKTDQRMVMTSQPGIAQIGRNQAVVIGGFDERGQKTSKCYVIQQDKSSLKVNPGTELYNEATFESAFTYEGAIFAIQDSDTNRSKLLMGYRHEQWKFIAC